MAIEDIKKHIQDKAQEEIAQIEDAAKQEAQSLKQTWEDKIKAEEKRLIEAIQQNAKSKLAQVKFKIREKINAEELKAKQAQLDKVYDEALKKVADLPEDEYVSILEKLLKPIVGQEGTVHTTAKRAGALRQAAQNVGCSVEISDKDLDTVGGFIFEGVKIDLDNRFETLMKRVREETIIQTHKTLFNA